MDNGRVVKQEPLKKGTLEEAVSYGATHYSLTKDGKVDAYYRYHLDPFYGDGTKVCLEYLSYCNIWQGSNISKEAREKLVKIE